MRRWRWWRGKREFEAETGEELRDHLERQVSANLASGMTPEEARRQARLQLGAVEGVKESCREERRGFWLETLWADVRYGLRIMRRNPGFTLAAVLTLALGIGANTAIFSVLESQLWRRLPFPDSERLMDVHVVLRENPKQWDVLSAGVFRAWRERSKSFTSMGGYLYPEFHNLTANGTSERVTVMAVTASLFDTLGIPPAAGRPFTNEQEAPGRDHVAIVSDRLWRERFSSDAGLVGRPITIDGESYTVIGISSPRLRFEYVREPGIFVPLGANASTEMLRNLYAIGRLAPGVGPEQAGQELAAILEQERRAQGARAEDTADVKNLREEWTGFAARPLYFFAGAVALVLLIACVNAAGLLLARGLARQREFVLRAALGARRGRLVRQMMVESLLLTLAGGAAGALAGVWLARWFSVFLPEDALPRQTSSVALDGRVFAMALAACVIAAFLVGVGPALFAARAEVNEALRGSGSGRSSTRAQRHARSLLVAIEVALGLVLLFGAGLFLSSFARLQEAPRGFDAPGALTFRVALRGDEYAKPEQMRRYFDRLTEDIRALPGAGEVTLGSGLPLTGSTELFASVKVAGRPPIRPWGWVLNEHAVAANYFHALHMRMLAGRTFNAGDGENSPRVAIVNRNAVHDVFRDEDPVGKVLEFVADERRGVPAQPPVEIVGVTENAQEFGADEVPFANLYVPFTQHPVGSAFVLVSSNMPRGALAGGIRGAAYALDKNQPIFDMKTMDDRVADSLRGARFNLFLVSALAAVAILLVCVGMFGTVAYFVRQRTQEFGIRLALGATPMRILQDALTQSLRIGMGGVLAGVAVSLVLGRLLRHALYMAPHEHTGMLYGVSIHDPMILGAACALLTGLVLAASYFPARRAMRVDPMEALRYE